MAPKPRSAMNKHGIDNLYIKQDRRTGRFYAQYKDPRTGKFFGLGAGNALDSEEMQAAKVRAKNLNALIANQLADAKTKAILDNRPSTSLITVSGWLVEYRKIQQTRHDEGEIRPNTWRTKKHIIKHIDQLIGKTPLSAVTIKQVKDDVIDHYVNQGKNRMAQSVRSVLIDVFKEAKQAGEVPAGFNPAEETKPPKAKVQRARLTLEGFKAILAAAEKNCDPWVANAMLLAMVTGQRLEDIASMEFKQVNGDYLEVIQEKTGACLKIPLKLRLNSINWSIDEVVKRCRDRVVSKYMIHHTKPRTMSKRGDRVHTNTVSKGFLRARRSTDLEWPDSTPPTFHEMRSLAEREYRKQGIDTQSLLGHKEAKTTDIYHDARGHDWVIIDVQ